MKYLIESIKHAHGDHKVWWKPNKLGYTEYIEKAGRYSKEEAIQICDKGGSCNEKMWSEDDVLNNDIAGELLTVIREYT